MNVCLHFAFTVFVCDFTRLPAFQLRTHTFCRCCRFVCTLDYTVWILPRSTHVPHAAFTLHRLDLDCWLTRILPFQLVTFCRYRFSFSHVAHHCAATRFAFTVDFATLPHALFVLVHRVPHHVGYAAFALHTLRLHV